MSNTLHSKLLHAHEWVPSLVQLCNKLEIRFWKNLKARCGPKCEDLQEIKSPILEVFGNQATQFKFKIERVKDPCFLVSRNYLQLGSQSRRFSMIWSFSNQWNYPRCCTSNTWSSKASHVQLPFASFATNLVFHIWNPFKPKWGPQKL